MARPKKLTIGQRINHNGKDEQGHERTAPEDSIVIVTIDSEMVEATTWPSNTRLFFPGETIEPANHSESIIWDIIALKEEGFWSDSTNKDTKKLLEKMKALALISEELIEQLRIFFLLAYWAGYKCKK